MPINLERPGLGFTPEERNKRVRNQEKIEQEFSRQEAGREEALDYVANQAFTQVVDAARLEWQEPVATFADLSTTYPDASVGAAVMLQDTGKVYRFDGQEWKEIGQIDVGPVNELDTRLTTQLAEKAEKQLLALKRDKSVPIGLNDAASDLLTAINGGTTVIVESVPRDFSATPRKTTFFQFSKNLYNPEDPDYLIGKGFSGSTNTQVESSSYNISGYMVAGGGERVLISNAGVETSKPTFYKVASYDNLGVWISTQTYAIGGILLPDSTSSIRVQVDASATAIQVEIGNIVTSYEDYKSPTIQQSSIPEINKDKIKDLNISAEETDFITPTRNLFNPNDQNIMIGKGFSGLTNTIVDAVSYNISGNMIASGGDRVMISDNGAEVSNPTWYKVASYTDSGVWLSTQVYSLGGIVLPVNTKQIRMSYDKTKTLLQVEIGSTVTNYIEFGFRLQPKYLEVEKPSVINELKFTSFGDSLTFREKWQLYVASYFGLAHTNLGIGSTTLAYVEAYESEFPSFTNQARLDAIMASDPDVLTILGGANDAHRNVPIGTSTEFGKTTINKDKTNFIGAYCYIVETLLTWKPTLKIVILTTTQAGPEWNYNYKPYADAAKEVAENYALPCVDLYAKSGISKFNSETYTIDGLHQNDLGGKNVANLVIDEFKSISYV